ncbi:MAG: hypothetical protein M1833_005241 [Piccolia ochrophora]|nr:MAG: hypothetical protein M1833_005241 [Piccolia ochrophora]
MSNDTQTYLPKEELIFLFVSASGDPAKSDTTHRIRVGKNFTWFSVKAEDYLSRGNAAQGLKGKLHAFLHDQGISSNKYPYAYLVTAPRFCGYQFNPVSFWYLYDSNKRLQGMILEVNNTFDERRPYYLERNNETEVSDHGLANGHVHKEPAQKPISRDCKAAPEGPISFRATWAKDFHVSPFNSRKGSYDLLAFDPLRSSVAEDCQVNNTITLKSSKDHEKLEARVFSTEAAIDPSQSTSRDTARLIVAWWWVGFMTFPRIVKEAGKLFFREKLSVWYRPEVRERSIGRHEDATERILELYFRQYLRHQVETSATPLTVDYVMPSNVSAATETFRTVGTSDPPQHLTIKISSPIFYSRFVRYAHPMEAVSAEYLCAREDSKTLWTSDPTLLPVLFERRSSHKESTVAPSHGVADHWRWSIIRYLRRTPSPPQDNQNPSKAPTQSCEDIRLLPLAPIDEFVIGQCSYEESRDYRRNVMKLFLADYLAFGIPAMLHAYDLVLRCVLVYLGVAGVAGVRHWGLAGGLVRIAWGLGVCNGMHGWALLKSFA